MAIKNIIAKGLGFAPATAKWIVTHGFGAGAAAPPAPSAASPGASSLPTGGWVRLPSRYDDKPPPKTVAKPPKGKPWPKEQIVGPAGRVPSRFRFGSARLIQGPPPAQTLAITGVSLATEFGAGRIAHRLVPLGAQRILEDELILLRLVEDYDEGKHERDAAGKFSSTSGEAGGEKKGLMAKAKEKAKAVAHAVVHPVEAANAIGQAVADQHVDIKNEFGHAGAVAILAVAAAPVPGTFVAPIVAKLIKRGVQALLAKLSGPKTAVATEAIQAKDLEGMVDAVLELLAKAHKAAGVRMPTVSREKVKERLWAWLRRRQ